VESYDFSKARLLIARPLCAIKKRTEFIRAGDLRNGNGFEQGKEVFS